MQGDFGDEEIAQPQSSTWEASRRVVAVPDVAEPAPAHYHLVSELGEERDLETVAQVLGDRIPEVEAFAVKKLAENKDALLLDFKAVSEA